jgi:hypothetical protein
MIAHLKTNGQTYAVRLDLILAAILAGKFPLDVSSGTVQTIKPRGQTRTRKMRKK